MMKTPPKMPWLVRVHHRMRVIAYILVFLDVCLHVWAGKEYSLAALATMTAILLIYPQVLLHGFTRRARDPVAQEFINLRIDSFLLGVFMGAAEFPLWLSFCTSISTLTNNTANKGWRAVPETLALLAAGALSWIAIAGPRFSPEMGLPATLLCIGGLSWYLLTVNNIGFARNVQLRETRETLRTREADLVTANEALQRNLTEIAMLQQQLAEQANRDPLTGLYNRRYLDSTLERELARCKREGQPISLILIDIDHFKRINDTYGHQAGDKVLQQLGLRLGSLARAGDIACRYGGEEFLLLMPTMTLETARERAEDLREGFGSTAVAFGEFEILTTLSIGISVYPGNGTSPDELIRSADRALYRAKHQGRNCTEIAHAVVR